MDNYTVRYTAEHYLCSGNVYYYRQQLIRDEKSAYWGRRRAITKSTYDKAKRDGHMCEWVDVDKDYADVIDFYEIRRFRSLREQWRRG